VLTGCGGEGRQERGIGFATIRADGVIEVSVGCPSDEPTFTVEEDDERVALSVSYTDTDNACARSASPLLAAPLGDRTVHDRLTGDLAVVEDLRCWPPRQGARCDGVPSAPAPPLPPRPDHVSETTALPATTLALPPTTTTVGPPPAPTTTTTGPPPVELPRTGACGEAAFYAASADDTVAVLVTVDARRRSTDAPTQYTVERAMGYVHVEVVSGRRLSEGFCTDMLVAGHLIDDRVGVGTVSGTIVLQPPATAAQGCGVGGVLHLDDLTAAFGRQFAAIDIETDVIGCTPG
jgi:hypothetical protein